MGMLKRWMTRPENREGVIENDDLIVILNEIDSNFVSIRGNPAFPITYSVLATVKFLKQNYLFK